LSARAGSGVSCLRGSGNSVPTPIPRKGDSMYIGGGVITLIIIILLLIWLL
jgi:hypothetical protein